MGLGDSYSTANAYGGSLLILELVYLTSPPSLHTDSLSLSFFDKSDYQETPWSLCITARLLDLVFFKRGTPAKSWIPSCKRKVGQGHGRAVFRIHQLQGDKTCHQQGSWHMGTHVTTPFLRPKQSTPFLGNAFYYNHHNAWSDLFPLKLAAF